MSDSLHIREESAGDEDAVRRINALAFAGPGEADVVDAVRAAGAVILSLVAEQDGVLVGHIMFSPVSIEGPAARVTAVGLAPMAVLPGCQGKGIGSRLVREGLSELRRRGHGVVVVLAR